MRVLDANGMQVQSFGRIGVGLRQRDPALPLDVDGVIGVFDQAAAPTASVTDTILLWAYSAIAGFSNLYSRNEGGRVEQITGTMHVCSTPLVKNNDATLASVTGLEFGLEAGATYSFWSDLYTTSAATGGVKAAVAGSGGLTATSIIYEVLTFDAGAVKAQGRGAALGTAAGGVTAVTAALMRITGTIVVNAGGTIAFHFAQNAADASNSTALAGSWSHIRRIS